MLAANAPDIDVLGYVRGEYFALAFRRGITHGWPALLVAPFVVTALVLAWDRGMRRRRTPDASPARAGPLLALSALGAATHPTLDWMNTYGMRWSLPFDGSWSYGDALFIIDPWIWLVLGGAVFLSSRPGGPARVGWGALAAIATSLVVLGLRGWLATSWVVGLGIVALVRHRRGPERPIPARAVGVACAAVVAYVAVLVVADARARDQVRAAAAAEGIAVEDVMVAPLPGNPFRSTVEVRTGAAYVPGLHTWLERPRVRLEPAAAVPVLTAPAGVTAERARALVAMASAESPLREYLVWSRYPYFRVAPEGAGWRVSVSDARYDDRRGPGGLQGTSVLLETPTPR